MKGLIPLLAALLGLAAAQTRLLVNGAEVAGATTSLVSGKTYAPAEAFAQALGARYTFSQASSRAAFELAGRLAVLEVYDSAWRAGTEEEALSVNEQRRASSAGVWQNGTVYVPVASLANAFGGSSSYIGEQNMIVVMFPRARLRPPSRPERHSDYERLVFELSAPTAVIEQFSEPLNSLRIRFERSDVDLSRSVSLEGQHFRNASLMSSAGRSEFLITLEPGRRYELYSVPRGTGFNVVLDIIDGIASDDVSLEVSPRRASIVIDPATAGRSGDIRESELTLQLARRLKDALESRDYPVTLTRENDSTLDLETRSNMGVGADVFVSLHAAGSGPEVRVYTLGDAVDIAGMDAAIRRNADSELARDATDSVRRRVLLGLVPDLGRAEQYAQRLRSELSQRGSYQVSVASAPLYLLGGAAGRGLALEVSPSLLDSASFASDLASALERVLQEVEAR